MVSSWPSDPTVDDGLGTDLALGYTANKLCRGSPHRRGELLYDANPSRPPGSQTHYRCRPPFNSSHDLRCIHYCFTSVAFVVYIIVPRLFVSCLPYSPRLLLSTGKRSMLLLAKIRQGIGTVSIDTPSDPIVAKAGIAAE